MSHSQALSATPLRPWIVVQKDGEVVTAHCTCMAGLGEACSHIAATLFTIEAAVKKVKETACTSLPCVWSDSSGGKADFAEGYEIDFTSPARKRSVLNAEGVMPTPTLTKSREIPLPTPEENNTLYDQLMATGVRCAVLSLTPKHAPKLCYCQSDNVLGNILECKSGYCKIVKFHQTCLGLKYPPKRKWLCPDCRTATKKNK